MKIKPNRNGDKIIVDIGSTMCDATCVAGNAVTTMVPNAATKQQEGTS